jgi:hypothetical protein
MKIHLQYCDGFEMDMLNAAPPPKSEDLPDSQGAQPS